MSIFNRICKGNWKIWTNGYSIEIPDDIINKLREYFDKKIYLVKVQFMERSTFHSVNGSLFHQHKDYFAYDCHCQSDILIPVTVFAYKYRKPESYIEFTNIRYVEVSYYDNNHYPTSKGSFEITKLSDKQLDDFNRNINERLDQEEAKSKKNNTLVPLYPWELISYVYESDDRYSFMKRLISRPNNKNPNVDDHTVSDYSYYVIPHSDYKITIDLDRLEIFKLLNICYYVVTMDKHRMVQYEKYVKKYNLDHHAYNYHPTPLSYIEYCSNRKPFFPIYDLLRDLEYLPTYHHVKSTIKIWMHSDGLDIPI